MSFLSKALLTHAGKNDYGASLSELVDDMRDLNEPASEDYGGGWLAGKADKSTVEEKTMTGFLTTIDKDLFKVGDSPREASYGQLSTSLR